MIFSRIVIAACLFFPAGGVHGFKYVGMMFADNLAIAGFV